MITVNSGQIDDIGTALETPMRRKLTKFKVSPMTSPLITLNVRYRRVRDPIFIICWSCPRAARRITMKTTVGIHLTALAGRGSIADNAFR